MSGWGNLRIAMLESYRIRVVVQYIDFLGIWSFEFDISITASPYFMGMCKMTTGISCLHLWVSSMAWPDRLRRDCGTNYLSMVNGLSGRRKETSARMRGSYALIVIVSAFSQLPHRREREGSVIGTRCRHFYPLFRPHGWTFILRTLDVGRALNPLFRHLKACMRRPTFKIWIKKKKCHSERKLGREDLYKIGKKNADRDNLPFGSCGKGKNCK